MADEKIEETEVPKEETPEEPETPEPETPEEPSTPEPGEEPEEPKIPLSRLRKEADKRKELEEKLQEVQEKEIPEDKKKIWEAMDERQKLQEEKALKAEKDEEEKLDELEEIHGDFDRKKFKEFLDEYPAYDGKGGIDYHKSYKFFERVGSTPEPPKKKTPSSQRTTDVPKKEPYDVSKKSMWEIIE